MRTILIAALTAAGIGLLGTPGAFAAPANGAAIGAAATAETMIVDARLLTSRRICVQWRVYKAHRWMTKYVSFRRCVRWRHA